MKANKLLKKIDLSIQRSVLEFQINKQRNVTQK